MVRYYEEGETCPSCGGVFEVYSERGCTCFIVAPCSACVDSILKCDHCGYETDKDGLVDEEEFVVESQVMHFA